MRDKIYTALEDYFAGPYKERVDKLEDVVEQREATIQRQEKTIEELREPPKPAVETKQVSQGFIGEALRELPRWSEIRVWRPMDGQYHVPTRESFNRVIRWDGTDEKRYYSDTFDCDDFTIAMRSLFAKRYQINAVGSVITYAGNPHAFNVVVFADQSVAFFEPQNDQFVEPNSKDKYTIDGAVVHL